LLGKYILVARRHVDSVGELTPQEWLELHRQIRRATTLLVSVFYADHFNYAFLQNQDRHVHLHIIPRYAEPRQFAGELFEDPDYPGHYAVPSPVRSLTDEQAAALADALRRKLTGFISNAR